MVRFSVVLLRWKIELREHLETIWENRWCGIALTGVFTIAVACLFYRVPAPGVSVAVMGVVAAIMAARTKATGAEKAAWMLIISALLVIEIAAINKERYYARLTEEIRTGQEQRKFGELRDDIRGAATQTTQQLDAAMTKEKEVLRTTQLVADLAEKSLENITGGQSFAVVTPQVWSGLVPIPLTIYNYGKQTLIGVTVTIRDPEAWDFFRNPYSMYQAQASAISVGTLHVGEMKTLVRTIRPSVEGNGAGILGEGKDRVCQYQLDISAQNFTVTENLTFKKGVRLPWVFRYVVTRQFVKSQVKNTINYGYTTLADTKKWMGEN